MAQVLHETRIIEDNRTRLDGRQRIENTASQIIYTIAAVIMGLLVIRLVLALLGANPANTFANLIYTLSRPLVAPFFGLFNYTTRLGVSRFEYETVVAIIVYGILAGILSSIFGSRRAYPE